MELMGLLVAMYLYLGNVEVRVVDGPVIATAPDGQQYKAVAISTECVMRNAHIEAPPGVLSLASPGILAHELLHIVDCRDDGAYQGSLLPYLTTSKDPAHEWVYWALRNPEAAAKIINALPR